MERAGLRIRTRPAESRFAPNTQECTDGDQESTVTKSRHSESGLDHYQGDRVRSGPCQSDGSTWNLAAIALYAAYLMSAATYFYVRARYTLDLGDYWWYGVLVLTGEAAGASTVVLYGLCIIRRLPESEGGFRRLDPGSEDVQGLHFSIQILVPCYSEALDIVAETVWAAHTAQLPAGCTATVWLLDDGGDLEKEAWVQGLATDGIKYVTGRKRPKGEVNGKAGNLNHLLDKLYPAGACPADSELVVVFDCDQVCDRNFFMQTLPLLRDAPDVALVLTPQKFGNVDGTADIFNHSNRHFWEAMIPGLTAWGMVVCTGSNFVIRAKALHEAGHFPTRTVTEDYALGMELAKRGYRARYLAKYLAKGEAPEEGAIFRQRSRWCKGHLQEFMGRECPLLQGQLSWKLRILYFSGTWSYVVAAICTPLFVVVPIVCMRWRVFPIALVPSFVAAFIPYFILMHAVIYYCGSLDLLRALWFGSCASHILWYTYLKALWNTSLCTLGLKKRARFKTTVKTGVNAAATAPADAAPGTAKCLSRTVTPSTIPPFSLPETSYKLLPTHRPTASAPLLLRHLSVALSGSPKAAPGCLSVFANSSLQAHEAASGVRYAPEEDIGDAGSRPSDGSGNYSSGSSLGSLQRTLTMPQLQQHMAEGIRPGWNLLVAGPPSAVPGNSPVGSFAASNIMLQSNTVIFDRLRVKSITFGVLRDVWLPLLVLCASLWSVLSGVWHMAWGGPRTLAMGVSILWALYNCIGPYMLLHYTWLGRGHSLKRAATCGMALAAAILFLAAAAVWLFTPAVYDYGEVLGLSYRFYEAQRSGPLLASNRIPWRGDSALRDTSPGGSSLAGGWYDAGDHLKTSFSIAIASALIAWGMLEFPQGHAAALQAEVARDNLRWAADYLMACHTSHDEFVGQVGQMDLDHSFWGRPEDMDAAGMLRPVYVINSTHPGADMAGAAAAALAATAQVFKDQDPDYAADSMKHSRQLFQMALDNPGSFADSVPEMGAVYPSQGWRDDVAWGAAWLYSATQEPAYLEHAQAFLGQSYIEEADRWQYYASNWNNMLWSTHTLLARLTRNTSSMVAAASFLDKWRSGAVVRYTARGLAYADDWGTLRNAANAAMLALVFAKERPESDAMPYQCWALSQIRYMLGDGRRSLVVGYGKRPPLRPHHRAASCPWPPAPCNISAMHSEDANPHVMYGALVGGPFPDDTYPDNRADHVKSEVGIEYSAGFTAALAGLAEVPVSWSRCLQGQTI